MKYRHEPIPGKIYQKSTNATNKGIQICDTALQLPTGWPKFMEGLNLGKLSILFLKSFEHK